tara:strand:+ start:50 stop:532 length:483 start_codon:yes stop_codon:yes gene_type:complete
MTIIVEDGSIVPGANSYITVAEYEAWIDARYPGHPDHGDSAKIEQLIFRAMDYFETQAFRGWKQTDAQPLQFPRYNLIIDGFLVANNTIPSEVKKALYEIVYADEKDFGLFDVIQRRTRKEKVDVLEVEYMDNSASRVLVPAAAAWMRKLLMPRNMVVHI